MASNKVVRRLVVAIAILFLGIVLVGVIGVTANIKAGTAECKATNDAKVLIGGLIDIAEQNSTQTPPGVVLTPAQKALREASRRRYEDFRGRIDAQLTPINC